MKKDNIIKKNNDNIKIVFAYPKDEKLTELVVKKVKKGLSVSEIADVLEEDEETIRKIIESLK